MVPMPTIVGYCYVVPFVGAHLEYIVGYCRVVLFVGAHLEYNAVAIAVCRRR